MVEVIPVINCLDLPCVVDELHRLEKFATRVHLDVADGKYTFHKTWNDPAMWRKLKPRAEAEVHLMIEEPENAFEEWIRAGAKRLIIHYESLFDSRFRPRPADGAALLERIITICNERRVELLLAINPETPAQRLSPYFGKVRGFQVLAVHPGLAGQRFLPVVLEKVKFLRRALPQARIEVDGGINFETGRLAKAAGADILTSSKYILESVDAAAAYETLTRL